MILPSSHRHRNGGGRRRTLRKGNALRNEDRETWAEAWGDALTKLMDLAIKALGDSISVNMEKTRKSDIVR